jgi:hypothetical protein
MAGVAGGDCEATRERRPVPGSLRSNGFGDRAVQTTTALLEILASPILGKCNGKADAVGLAIGPGSAIDDAVDAAVRRQLWTRLSAPAPGRRACQDHFGTGNLDLISRHLKLC